MNSICYIRSCPGQELKIEMLGNRDKNSASLDVNMADIGPLHKSRAVNNKRVDIKIESYSCYTVGLDKW